MEIDYKLADTVVADTLGVIYAAGVKDKVVTLTNFDVNDKGHLCIFHCALIAQDIFHFQVRIRLKLFDWIAFILKHPHAGVKRTRKVINEINCVNLNNAVTEKYHHVQLFDQIYHMYYQTVPAVKAPKVEKKGE